MFSLRVCSTKLCNLVSSIEYLVSNGGQVLLEGIRLGGCAKRIEEERDESALYMS